MPCVISCNLILVVDGADFINDGSLVFTFFASYDFIQVRIPLIDDGIYELTETFTAGLSFTSDVPPRFTISPNNANITITDDESMFKKSTVRIQFII